MYRILYVDDEPSLLEIGKLFLERSGQFIVDTITSAPAALTLLNSKSYDAIIADYQMPDMDGIEFLKKIRTSGNAIPFILFTGRGREEVVIQALNEGADFYLQKGGEPKSQFIELAHQTSQAIQQRRAEANIRDLERREADIINFLPDATFAIDTDGLVIAWNRAIEEMTGVPATEMLGKRDYEYAIPFYGQRQPILIDLIFESEEAIAKKYAHIIHKKDILLADTTLPHLKGKPATLMGIASPLYDRHGKIVGAIESIRDITERRRAEEEIHSANDQLAASAEELRSQYDELAKSEKRIRESGAQFRSIFENSPYPIAISDSRTGKYVFTNEAFQRITGYPEEEIIGRDAQELGIMTPGDLKRRTALYQTQEKVESELFTIIKKGGDTKSSVLISFIPITTNNQPAILTMAVDITERIWAEGALRESEQRYRNVVEDQTEFISRFSPDGIHVFVNEAYCRCFGLKRDKILGHRFRPKIPVEDQKRVKQFFESLTMDHPVGTIEHRIIMPDGSIRWQRWSDRAIFDPSGTITEYLSVGQDITEEKETEKALQESEQRNSAILAAMPDLLFVLSRDGTCLDFQAADKNLLAMPPDQIIGKNILDAGFDADAAKAILLVISAAIETDTLQQVEYKLAVPAGISWFEARLVRHGADRVLGIVRDITERKQKEQVLHENEQRLTSIYNTVGDSIFQLTVEPHEQYRFTSVNSAFSRTIGVPPEQVIGKKVTEIIPEPSLSIVLEKYRQAIEEKAIVRWEETSDYPSGQLIGDVSVAPIFDEAGNCTHLIGSVHDITERKKAEEASRQANRKLAILINITRHDINNQLLALNGFVELLREKIPDPALENYFTWIKQASTRISSIGQFAKIYTTIGETAPRWQDIRTLVDTAAKQVPLGKILVKNDLPAGIEVFADPLIFKVFYNLIENAVRYGRKITTIRFSAEECDGTHVVVCEDDGDGIPAEDKERIFDWGFGENTGLGLALSREILGLTGITIRENGEPGKGARFAMVVPPGSFRI
ncbi:MAG: PAS domain S-box protein [Methanoregula sp.]|jgi:PAS domain S-box-containing protein|uniref:hybrid sensor histidine kinase/response regulator n=1 Tax=Methanoregula sp. TaxID=2052170 RepID=UPI003C20CF27